LRPKQVQASLALQTDHVKATVELGDKRTARAAELLGISERALRYKLKKYSH